MCAPTVQKNKAQEIREKKAALARKKTEREKEERQKRAVAKKEQMDILDRRKREAQVPFWASHERPSLRLALGHSAPL